MQRKQISEVYTSNVVQTVKRLHFLTAKAIYGLTSEHVMQHGIIKST